ncbi:hypothetical protein GALMADRAFT_1064120 [Galerina marginata CBS 339.88]|uniref:Uncharacterized protein n=1 Tax=Galerina marginata (strain CBS 339.88) TaxID=685588 RepID=A0A067SM16_GALM3|nr:hypothetical protein GALMADRAFT_1064120 [Galerina marginata CBS 339.88]
MFRRTRFFLGYTLHLSFVRALLFCVLCLLSALGFDPSCLFWRFVAASLVRFSLSLSLLLGSMYDYYHYHTSIPSCHVYKFTSLTTMVSVFFTHIHQEKNTFLC